jgi:RNA polymerase sigma-70 factor (sigma-E family)
MAYTELIASADAYTAGPWLRPVLQDYLAGPRAWPTTRHRLSTQGRCNLVAPVGCPWCMAIWDAPASFDEYVHSRHRELLRFAHVLCGDAHLAADLVQDALERTGLSWRRLRRQDDPEGYVRRTIVNQYLNRRRRLRRERLVAQVPDRADPQPTGQRDERIWHLLAQLPRQQRAVLVLRFYEDMTEAAIAEVLGCSLGTVKSNSSRALAKLRAVLEPATVEGRR